MIVNNKEGNLLYVRRQPGVKSKLRIMEVSAIISAKPNEQRDFAIPVKIVNANSGEILGETTDVVSSSNIRKMRKQIEDRQQFLNVL